MLSNEENHQIRVIDFRRKTRTVRYIVQPVAICRMVVNHKLSQAKTIETVSKKQLPNLQSLTGNFTPRVPTSMSAIQTVQTPRFAHCAVAWSPFHNHRLAIASAANFGLVGNGRLHTASLVLGPAGPHKVNIDKL